MVNIGGFVVVLLLLLVYLALLFILVSWNVYIALAYIFISSILMKAFLPTIKGYIGEKRVNKILHKLGDGYYIYDDLYVTKDDSTTSQIDHVVLCKYGVFVIETKNYVGWIFGTEQQKNWTQVIYKNKSRFYNPIIQNKAHMKALKRFLNMEDNFFSIIVFSDEATFKFDTNFIEAIVIKNTQLLKTIRQFREEHISSKQLKLAQQKLDSLVIADRKVKRQIKHNHVKQLKAAPIKEVTNIECPKCGSKMKLKKGKYGEFYGCTSYPSCRYTKKYKI